MVQYQNKRTNERQFALADIRLSCQMKRQRI